MDCGRHILLYAQFADDSVLYFLFDVWVFLLHINDSMSYLFKSKLSIDNSKLLAAIRLKYGLYIESQKLIIHSPYNKIYINEYR